MDRSAETSRVSAEPARIIVCTPFGRDAEIACGLIRDAGFDPVACTDLPEILRLLPPVQHDALCLVITEEALLDGERSALAAWIEQQPPWSDFPVIILGSRGQELDGRLSFLNHGHIVLERPFSAASLTSAVASAARARTRQLQVKAYIEEREKSDERQKLLIRELHHRVKNTLANVQAMLGATARSHTDIDSFTRAFSSRIVSLSRTHEKLTEDYWQTASLRRILTQELDIYDTESGRFGIEGPDIHLVSDIAVPLGMAFHELATNAVKYGALSVDRGRIDVHWSIMETEGDRRLSLDWREANGPIVTQPTRKGFGSVLLERVLTVQCQADIRTDFAENGFSLHLAMPLPKSRLVPQY
ncbi:Histidine kinase [Rhizobium sp. EC-SD404]|nr:Histidine kinase [Rhizobium sp. EC-SD404]